ncbi:SDR family NAD(P)-dependent oxidoreductase [Vibrio sp. VB16]|uniref:SDR family NAD(P)-dependent oxidoreductase n=1 Tax=Vibrio sp. VB16 TaxID=2785746 RepID=UPI0018A00B9B|nr:SDR family NAD(P)-dependent oxidoreductase [Vibrio sp. VB16]UGA56065.1 SDR family NAD(P)-dependent oxidoreductase [Vibrio sp. VB16]
MILITGASSGLGAALAKLHSVEEESLTIIGRDKAKLANVCQGLPSNVKALSVDLADAAQVSSLFDSIQRPNMVIHCAGSGYFGAIEHQEPNQIRHLIDNNLLTTIHLLQELVKRYKDESVRVVIVMSTAAQAAKAGESTYCAVKWGVKGLVESVRLELKGKKMKLIGVYPGGMATEFWQTSGKELDTSSFMSADEAASMIKDSLHSTKNGYISDISVNRT